MKPGEILLLGCVAVAGVIWVTSPLDLPYWQGRTPGTSFIPFWIGLATLVSLALLVLPRLPGGARSANADRMETQQAPASNPRKPLFVLVALVACVALIESFGFVVATVAFAVVTERIIERRSWTATAWVMAAIVLIAVMFQHGLGVPLPTGPLGF